MGDDKITSLEKARSTKDLRECIGLYKKALDTGQCGQFALKAAVELVGLLQKMYEFERADAERDEWRNLCYDTVVFAASLRQDLEVTRYKESLQAGVVEVLLERQKSFRRG